MDLASCLINALRRKSWPLRRGHRELGGHRRLSHGKQSLLRKSSDPIQDSTDQTVVVGVPLVTSLVLYVAIGLAKPERQPDRDALVDSLDDDPVEKERVPVS
ncbi:hypothetical protein GCM10023170_021850 [Phytohabitans houttuyneae]|uniref:Uncharacterized protein n=1 Tax=Phytohabitans houttuyneae TaxID=1076126 RepID=A0A6V8K2K9_9ACTN|nr:hypothetical protein Phou_005890 [Phytohabitans houttuyneae]